jgi:hypothetical protein
MKKGILFLLLFVSVFAEAQSLKEALFRGKLKNDNNTVIRKGDDLSKVAPDTTRKVAPDSTLAKTGTIIADSTIRAAALAGDTAAIAAVRSADSTAAALDTTMVAATEPAEPVNTAAITKDNNAVWKTFVDTVSSTIRTDVLPNKRIKKGMYYVTVSYSINTDGKVEVTDVFLSPENGFLHSQIKDRLEIDAPRLEPVLNSAGTPRKVSRKYNFTLVKE